MVFSSAVFLWGFLPAVCVINKLLPHKYSNIFLLLSSLFFYAWGEPVMVLLMMISITVNWFVGLMVYSRKNHKKAFLTAGIIFNLLVLGYYKYFAFFLDIISGFIGFEALESPEIRLPIGISFFTFQAISFIIDVFRNDVDSRPELLNTALYISFFPQLIAGPIVKYREIEAQITSRTVTADKFAEGFRRFIYGLSKKVLLSNALGQCADSIYNLDIMSVNGAMAWVAALCYTFQIYYDFSGYSDMAIGLGKMFGFDILENFNYPYISKSIREFWRRWHISLSSWFREYVYIPLGGNRKGVYRTYINLSIVFFLTGLWHGANYTFVLWGLYHGFFSILERVALDKILKKNSFISHCYCLTVVVFGWVLFRIESLDKCLAVIQRMLMPWAYSDMGESILNFVDLKLGFIFVCAVIGCGLIQKISSQTLKKLWNWSVFEVVYCAALLLLCIFSIASSAYNPFIYFQF